MVTYQQRIPSAWSLVTGASDGIGAAIARCLAAQGRPVLLAARRQDRLRTLASELTATHGVATRIVVGDLGEASAVAALINASTELDLDTVVLAAGFGSSGPFLDSDLHTETAMVDVNCRAVVALAHTLGGRMATRGGGSLVLLSSLVAFQGVPRAATYAASKAFIQSFGEALAPELRQRGVNVLTVAPGPVRSGFADRAGMQMGATDSPATVAAAVLRSLDRGGSFLRPGLVGKLLGWSLATAPRSLRVRIMGAIMGGMTAGKA